MQHNPFSTRKTTPGRIPYYFTEVCDSYAILCFEDQDEQIFEHLYSVFISRDYRSQIIGSHGTGKTTFLFEFVRFLESQDHIVYHFTLHDKQKFLSREFWIWQKTIVSQYKDGELKKPPIAVIDGYEQLSPWQKIRLRLACRKGRCGFLITTHAPAWQLPVLLRTEPTYQTLQYIIRHLFRNQPNFEPPDDTLCRSLFKQHHGNIRNVLLELYDHYEQEKSDFRLQTSEIPDTRSPESKA